MQKYNTLTIKSIYILYIWQDNTIPVKEAKSLGMELGFAISYSTNMRRIGISPTLNLLNPDDSKALILELFCEFEIHPEDWDKMIEGKKLTIPKSFVEYLLSQAVGTLRGVLYCKTEDTEYSFFVLPSINVSAIVKDDAAFTLE